jgi:hypothetical protein
MKFKSDAQRTGFLLGGHLENLNWMVEEEKMEDREEGMGEMVTGASRGGHFEILLWTNDRGIFPHLLPEFFFREGHPQDFCVLSIRLL